MAELKTKMIPYPNELEAMGLAYNGNTTSQGSVTPSNQSITNCIKGIIDYFKIDLGLVHVPTTGEIDTDNIIYPDIPSLATTFNNYNLFSNFNLGFIKFALNDALQDTKPLFLRFTFNIKTINGRSSDSNWRNRIAFNMALEIIHNDIVLHSADLGNIAGRQPWITPCSYGIQEQKTDSMGFYSGSRLFINLLPNRYVWWVSASYDVNSWGNRMSSYFSFYLERDENMIKFLQLSYLKEISSSNADNQYNNTNFVYIPYDQTKYNTTENVYIPYIDKRIGNNLFNAFRTIDYNPKTNLINENYNVLSCYSDQIGIVGNTVDLVINGETHKYLTYKNASNINMYYARNTSTGLLFRMD